MRLVIGGGGTGGHLYPGLAVAQAFKQRDPQTEVLFIGSAAGIEVEVLPREGFPLVQIAIRGIVGKRGWGKVQALSRLPLALGQALVILSRFRPDLVLGVGGYVSGPVITAAFLLRIPRLIHEQNLIPGMTNRLLGAIANRVAISFPDSALYFPTQKTVFTGNPVRPEIIQRMREKEERSPAETRFRLLIFGGSQGAHSLNMAMLEALPALRPCKESLVITHQTGKADWQMVQEAYAREGFRATVVPFIRDMGGAYAAADLVICRAGATTLAELSACGKAALLIPYPYATHNHQEINARNWQKMGAADLILDNELCGDVLAEKIRFYGEHREKLARMAAQSKRMGSPDATDRLVELCIMVAEVRRSGYR
ncbi:MAG: undecaprenyldiphospho-muramoylpentapeptide beta-N-acetylglucosaminyltransferase [Nitrospinota bacterium]|nr:MAG: undecaprenyldiphospho-muramoylpentapeptide beta-N-acetylglucosaminyltransferase [Nitrospinota bacterium]